MDRRTYLASHSVCPILSLFSKKIATALPLPNNTANTPFFLHNNQSIYRVVKKNDADKMGLSDFPILNVGESIEHFVYSADHTPVFLAEIYPYLTSWVLFAKWDETEGPHFSLCEFDQENEKFVFVTNMSRHFFQSFGVTELTELIFLKNGSCHRNPLFCFYNRDGALQFVVFDRDVNQFQRVYQTESDFRKQDSDFLIPAPSSFILQAENILCQYRFEEGLSFYEFRYLNNTASFVMKTEIPHGAILRTPTGTCQEVFELPKFHAILEHGTDWTIPLGVIDCGSSQKAMLYLNRKNHNFFGISYEQTKDGTWIPYLSVTSPQNLLFVDINFKCFVFPSDNSDESDLLLIKCSDQPYRFLHLVKSPIDENMLLEEVPFKNNQSKYSDHFQNFLSETSLSLTQWIVPHRADSQGADSDFPRHAPYLFTWVRALSEQENEIAFLSCELYDNRDEGVVELQFQDHLSKSHLFSKSHPTISFFQGQNALQGKNTTETGTKSPCKIKAFFKKICSCLCDPDTVPHQVVEVAEQKAEQQVQIDVEHAIIQVTNGASQDWKESSQPFNSSMLESFTSSVSSLLPPDSTKEDGNTVTETRKSTDEVLYHLSHPNSDIPYCIDNPKTHVIFQSQYRVNLTKHQLADAHATPSPLFYSINGHRLTETDELVDIFQNPKQLIIDNYLLRGFWLALTEKQEETSVFQSMTLASDHFQNAKKFFETRELIPYLERLRLPANNLKEAQKIINELMTISFLEATEGPSRKIAMQFIYKRHKTCYPMEEPLTNSQINKFMEFAKDYL